MGKQGTTRGQQKGSREGLGGELILFWLSEIQLHLTLCMILMYNTCRRFVTKRKQRTQVATMKTYGSNTLFVFLSPLPQMHITI
jgi:hypothetical protein